ncbi:MAG: hypothetical protein AB7O37_15630 [Vicinamibacteria bacterium]
MSARRSAGALLAGAAAAVALGLLVWPSLPPVNNDEYLPLLPLAFFDRPAEARSSLLAPYLGEAFGVTLPLKSYAYVGSLKGLLYAASGLPAEVTPHRAANLALLAIAFGLLAESALALSGGSTTAAGLVLALLASDVSLVVLGICDEGPIVLGLLLAAALLRLAWGLVASARPRAFAGVCLIVLVTALGVWDRLNFLWFVGAFGGGALGAALVRGQARRGLAVLAAMATGVGVAFASLSHSLEHLREGLAGRVPWTEGARLFSHASVLAALADPFRAYHRYVETGAQAGDAWLLAYRVLLLGGTALALLAALAFVTRGPARPAAAGLAMSGLAMAILVAALVSTSRAWASHHVAPLRPFAFLLLALVLARRPRAGTRTGLLLAAVFAAVGAHGLGLLRAAAPLRGPYGVTWNAVDAWRAAVRSEARLVLALDWGVFYPGAANSPPTQRWEMSHEPDAERLWGAVHGQPEVPIGLLYRSEGPRADLEDLARGSPNVETLAAARFAGNPGDSWSFLLVRPKGRQAPAVEASDSGALRNPGFERGLESWSVRAWESAPGASSLETAPCPGARCLWIRHFHEADTRLEQELRLDEPGRYELSAWARARGVPFERPGARIVFTHEATGGARAATVWSSDLRGTTDWHRLRLWLDVPAGGVRGRMELRLGGFGAPTLGEAWLVGPRLRRLPDRP